MFMEKTIRCKLDSVDYTLLRQKGIKNPCVRCNTHGCCGCSAYSEYRKRADELEEHGIESLYSAVQNVRDMFDIMEAACEEHRHSLSKLFEMITECGFEELNLSGLGLPEKSVAQLQTLLTERDEMVE